MGWSLGDLGVAGGMTLLLFCVLPLAQVLNRPDVEGLIRLREVSAVSIPPPPLVRMEPVSQAERAPEPIRVEMPSPSVEAMTPEPVRPMWSMLMPGSVGAGGLGWGGLSWEVLPGVFSLGEVDTPPRPLVQPPPLYPVGARRAGQEGVVELAFTVTAAGEVVDVEVLASRPGTVFVGAARSAVERWRFEPGMREGEPVAVRVEVPLQFRLER